MEVVNQIYEKLQDKFGINDPEVKNINKKLR